MTEYLEYIISIRDKTSNEEFDGTINIQLIAAKYSNTKNPIYKFVLNNKPISRNNTYLVKYSCPTCKTIQEITLNLFTRKISQSGKNCNICKNRDESKTSAQSSFMKTNSKLIITGEYDKPEKILKKEKSLDDHIMFSNSEWEKEDEIFKSQYLMHHLSVDEFQRIRKHIKGVNNFKIKDLSEWEYFPYYRIWNQTRYTPMLVNRNFNMVEKPYYITFDCENCDMEFTHRDLEIVKNKIKMYCKDCSFTNKIFRIRTLTTKFGEKIKWQSVQERRFIEWCDENRIQVKNGPNIEYIHNDSKKTYRVDFELPELKYLIELKDNHCWYKQQVLSGKQPAKEDAANKWCILNNYKYKMLFPKNIQEFKDNIKVL